MSSLKTDKLDVFMLLHSCYSWYTPWFKWSYVL